MSWKVAGPDWGAAVRPVLSPEARRRGVREGTARRRRCRRCRRGLLAAAARPRRPANARRRRGSLGSGRLLSAAGAAEEADGTFAAALAGSRRTTLPPPPSGRRGARRGSPRGPGRRRTGIPGDARRAGARCGECLAVARTLVDLGFVARIRGRRSRGGVLRRAVALREKLARTPLRRRLNNLGGPSRRRATSKAPRR